MGGDLFNVLYMCMNRFVTNCLHDLYLMKAVYYNSFFWEMWGLIIHETAGNSALYYNAMHVYLYTFPILRKVYTLLFLSLK